MNAGCEVKCVNVSSDAGHLAGLNYTPRVIIAKLKTYQYRYVLCIIIIIGILYSYYRNYTLLTLNMTSK